MGLEPIIALLTLIAIAVGVRLTRKHRPTVPPDPAFEAWCAGRPLLFALRCRDDGFEAHLQLRTMIGPSQELFNFQGRNPWPHYRLEIHCERRGDGVVLGTVHRAFLRAPKHRRADALPTLRALFDEPRAAVDELWLHGQLYAERPHDVRDRGRHGWLLQRIGDAAPTPRAMIGAPAWLAPHDGAGEG
jgi:hypothetical protein